MGVYNSLGCAELNKLTYKISSAYDAKIFGYMHCLICPSNCTNSFGTFIA